MNNIEKIYWKEGIQNARIDSRLISRWDVSFKRSILVQVQTVLRDRVQLFVPDLSEIEAEVLREEKEDDELFDEMWNEDIPLY